MNIRNCTSGQWYTVRSVAVYYNKEKQEVARRYFFRNSEQDTLLSYRDLCATVWEHHGQDREDGRIAIKKLGARTFKTWDVPPDWDGGVIQGRPRLQDRI
jgi:hypothetical protein